MAQLNMDCVRDLLQYLEANMRCRENGRIVRAKMKHPPSDAGCFL